MRVKLYESAIASRLVFSRKIGRPATGEFCNGFPRGSDILPHDVDVREVPKNEIARAIVVLEVRPSRNWCGLLMIIVADLICHHIAILIILSTNCVKVWRYFVPFD
jgi:hypothetical protein